MPVLAQSKATYIMNLPTMNKYTWPDLGSCTVGKNKLQRTLKKQLEARTHFLWGFVWLLNISARECGENKYVLLSATFHPTQTLNPWVCHPNCRCVVHWAFLVPCVAEPANASAASAWRGLCWLWLAWGWHWTEGEGERKRKKEMLIIWAEENKARESETDGETYTEKNVSASANAIFFLSQNETHI